MPKKTYIDGQQSRAFNELENNYKIDSIKYKLGIKKRLNRMQKILLETQRNATLASENNIANEQPEILIRSYESQASEAFSQPHVNSPPPPQTKVLIDQDNVEYGGGTVAWPSTTVFSSPSSPASRPIWSQKQSRNVAARRATCEEQESLFQSKRMSWTVSMQSQRFQKGVPETNAKNRRNALKSSEEGRRVLCPGSPGTASLTSSPEAQFRVSSKEQDKEIMHGIRSSYKNLY